MLIRDLQGRCTSPPFAPANCGGVAQHVFAVGVEALGLGRSGLNTRVGSGVGAGPGHPLPVELVVGDVAVDQEVQEVPGAHPPVDVEGLGEEIAPSARRPVVHPALVPQLAHAASTTG